MLYKQCTERVSGPQTLSSALYFRQSTNANQHSSSSLIIDDLNYSRVEFPNTEHLAPLKQYMEAIALVTAIRPVVEIIASRFTHLPVYFVRI